MRSSTGNRPHGTPPRERPTAGVFDLDSGPSSTPTADGLRPLLTAARLGHDLAQGPDGGRMALTAEVRAKPWPAEGLARASMAVAGVKGDGRGPHLTAPGQGWKGLKLLR